MPCVCVNCRSIQSNNKIDCKFSTHIQKHTNTHTKKELLNGKRSGALCIEIDLVHIVCVCVCISLACCLQDTCTLDISIIYGSDFCLFCCSHFECRCRRIHYHIFLSSLKRTKHLWKVNLCSDFQLNVYLLLYQFVYTSASACERALTIFFSLCRLLVLLLFLLHFVFYKYIEMCVNSFSKQDETYSTFVTKQQIK